MRQGQHSKKNRGRNRRQSNPGNRVFESNGPDVKIRGNASHVSEKYLALARDAQAAGDPIAAENYLQHAEHYLRIIAATQAQQQQQQNQPCAPDQRASSGDEQRGNGSAQPRGRNRRNGEAPADETQPEAAEASEATEPADAAKANGSDPEPAAEEVRKPRRRNGAKKAAAEEAAASEEVAEEVVSEDPTPETPEEQVSEAG